LINKNGYTMSKRIFSLFLIFTGLMFSQTMNVTIQPKFIEGVSGSNTARMPFAYFATISGLTPSSTYRYFNQIIISTNSATTNGAGNAIFVRSDSDFVRTTGPSMSTYGNYGEFTTDGTGSYSGWFVNEPTGNARFTPGGYVFFRVMLNDGLGGTSVVSRVTSSDSTKVIKFETVGGDTTGSGLWSRALVPAKSFVVLYDNEAGTGRPLAATFVENDGTANTTANSYPLFYSDSVNAIAGSWGVIIPNDNASGVRRIEARLLDGTLFPNAATSVDGMWGSVNTVNPNFGLTAAMIPPELAPLPVELASFSANVSVGVVELNWMTATELNNRAFEVERKTTGDWVKIGEVEGNGTTTSANYYSFQDRTLLTGKVSYRLKQIDYDGTFTYSNPIAVVINANSVEGESNPTVYALEQNYPNPFNPSTLIRFSMPVAGEVSLSVYNTLGQKVAQLLNSTMPAGYHQVEFNATDLPSGLYLYEVKAGSFSSSKKMLLIK
jgi:hypothetical protein